MDKNKVLALKYDLDRARDSEEFHALIMQYAFANNMPVLPRELYIGEVPEDYNDIGDLTPTDDMNEAHVLSSEIKGTTNMHAPVLDIDFPARLYPSSSPEHYHLYLDRAMEWRDYERLLWALADRDILQYKYVEHSVKRRATFVRKPGVMKETK